MITAVDTNVLVDVLTADPDFGRASRAALGVCLRDGNLVACDVVWAEFGAFLGAERTPETMERMGVSFSVLVAPSADIAARAWSEYRNAGGRRARLAGDFLIGGHASLQADRLLTRDRGFFRSYFPDLEVLDPSA